MFAFIVKLGREARVKPLNVGPGLGSLLCFLFKEERYFLCYIFTLVSPIYLPCTRRKVFNFHPYSGGNEWCSEGIKGFAAEDR